MYKNFTPTTIEVITYPQVMQCQVCQSTNTQLVSNGNSQGYVCLDCGTSEIYPQPPNANGQNTQTDLVGVINKSAQAL
jgi:hypothetical protein